VFVRGLLGWEPDAIGRTVRLAPQLPAEWDSLRVANLAIGDRRYDLSFKKTATELYLSVHRSAGSAGVVDTMIFVPHLPVGARLEEATASAGTIIPAGPPLESARDLETPFRLVLSGDATVRLKYQPGYEVILPAITSGRGDRSKGLRLVDLRRVGDSIAVLLDGPAGTSASIRLRHGAEREVPVKFPEPGDAIDGYSRAEVRVAQ
jgi:hypothetical protein